MTNVIKSLGVLMLVLGALVVPSIVSADTPWWCDSQFGSWWGIQDCGQNAGPAGILVYVQTQPVYGGGEYQPADFTVSVSGQNPSPNSFHGSQSGTPVVLGSGSYSVYVSEDLHGYTPSYSSGCSGTISTNGHALCVVTMTRSNYNSYPTPYPCVQGPYGGCTYPGNTLSCAPSYQTVAAGSAATFTAVGGSSSNYNWVTPNRTYLGVGSKLSVVLQSYGTQTVVVTSGGQSATCTVNVGSGPTYPVISGITPVVATPTVAAVVSGAPVVTSYKVPALPNTGFAPLDTASFAFAVVLLLGTGVFVLPYVRKAFVTVLR